MKAADAARLVALAAIWGASFLFIRIAAPVIGPAATADVRMLIAGGTLAAYYAATGFDAQWRRWWRYYLLIGALNCAAPFLLYGYSALELSVGLMAVLNPPSPLRGALLSPLLSNLLKPRPRLPRLVPGLAAVPLLSRPCRTGP